MAPSIRVSIRPTTRMLYDYPAAFYQPHAGRPTSETATSRPDEDRLSLVSTLVNDYSSQATTLADNIGLPLVYPNNTELDDPNFDPIYRLGEAMNDYLNRALQSLTCCRYHREYHGAHYDQSKTKIPEFLSEAREMKSKCLAAMEATTLSKRMWKRYQTRIAAKVQWYVYSTWKEYQMAVDCVNAWREVERTWVWGVRESYCHHYLEKEAKKIREGLRAVEEEFARNMGIDVWGMMEW